MRCIVLLALSTIRKNKNQMFSPLLILFFSAMLLNIGLLTAFRMDKHLDEKAQELNAAHISFAFEDRYYEDRFFRFFATREDTIATQRDDMFLFTGNLKLTSGVITILTICMDYNEMGAMSQVNLIGDSLPPRNNSVYVPYLFNVSEGVQLGDTFTIGINENPYDATKEIEFDFVVAGFYEGIFLSVTNGGAIGLYYPNEAYRAFARQLPSGFSGTLISAQFTDEMLSTAIFDEFINNFSGDENSSWGSNIVMAKSGRIITSRIVAAMVIAFSIIILIVSAIVIRFRVSNAIEVEMRNHGALKAIGYTSRQIISAICLQYLLLALFASLLGISVSYSVIVVFSKLLAAVSGINWVQGLNIPLSAVCLISVVLSIAAMVLMSSIKLCHMPPIQALRGNCAGFGGNKKNILPIKASILPLIPTLAIKTALTYIKQNVLITLIMTSVSFAVVFSIVLSYNAPRDTFVNMIGGQNMDISAMAAPKEDAEELRESISNLEGVSRTVICDSGEVIFNKQLIEVTILRDFSEIYNNQTYTGRNPSHASEVVISSILSEAEGKQIGDKVILSIGDREKELIITGLLQSPNNAGREMFLTTEGYRLLDPDYKESMIMIEIENKAEGNEFIQNLKQKYGEKLYAIMNDREFADSQLLSIQSMLNGVSVLVVIVTSVVVIFVMQLMVKTLTLRRKQDMGIQKAFGFTTLQLMNQISGSFVPAAALGASIGGVLGCLTMNACIGLLFRGIGITQVNFIIPVPIVVLSTVIMCILTYFVSMLVSMGIKDISAYALITE